MLTTAVALALFSFILLAISQWCSFSIIGHDVFSALSVVGTIYALLAGPLTTADCLSRERREGTLGLLFLTDLRSYDVVLGKLVAASLNIALDLTATLPVVAIPILMGGVSLSEFAFVPLTLVNIMFFSLAVGACASAFFASGRSALAVTLGTLLLLTLGLMFLGDVVLGIQMDSPAAPWFYLLCPAYAMQSWIGGSFATPEWDYWLNMGCTHALGWICLAIATWHTRNSWRNLPVSARRRCWHERINRWRKGDGASRLAWRKSLLDNNPVSWLAGRDRLQPRLLWGILLIAAILGAITHLLAPDKWPDPAWVVLWPIYTHYMLCLWIAIQAPRRLADDKESGALELLLCTPVTPARIVQGCMLTLQRWFGRSVLALLLLDVFFALACFAADTSARRGLPSQSMLHFGLCVLLISPVQTYSLARIGLYQGLVEASSVRATLMVIWKAALLPWLAWAAVMLVLQTTWRYWNFPVRLTEGNSFAALIGMHLLVCGFFLAHASWRLRWNFRALAGQVYGRTTPETSCPRFTRSN